MVAGAVDSSVATRGDRRVRLGCEIGETADQDWPTWRGIGRRSARRPRHNHRRQAVLHDEAAQSTTRQRSTCEGVETAARTRLKAELQLLRSSSSTTPRDEANESGIGDTSQRSQ